MNKSSTAPGQANRNTGRGILPIGTSARIFVGMGLLYFALFDSPFRWGIQWHEALLGLLGFPAVTIVGVSLWRALAGSSEARSIGDILGDLNTPAPTAIPAPTPESEARSIGDILGDLNIDQIPGGPGIIDGRRLEHGFACPDAKYIPSGSVGVTVQVLKLSDDRYYEALQFTVGVTDPDSCEEVHYHTQLTSIGGHVRNDSEPCGAAVRSDIVGSQTYTIRLSQAR